LRISATKATIGASHVPKAAPAAACVCGGVGGGASGSAVGGRGCWQVEAARELTNCGEFGVCVEGRGGGEAAAGGEGAGHVAC
jgi:hypothetical protein